MPPIRPTSAGHLPKPQEVKDFLDDFVIGQDQTRRKLPSRLPTLQAHPDEQVANNEVELSRATFC